MVTNWKGESTPAPIKPDSGVYFVQTGAEETTQEAQVNATKGKLKQQDGTNVECHICGENHFANECPKKGQRATPSGSSSIKTNTSRSRKKEQEGERNKKMLNMMEKKRIKPIQTDKLTQERNNQLLQP